MPQLLYPPSTRYHRSFLEAVEEFDGARMDGSGPVNGMSPAMLENPDSFARLVESLQGGYSAVVPDGAVPATALWMIERDEVVGFLQIRHRLTPFLLEQGGHIGYSVRPSMRRRGVASAALYEAMDIAAELGLEQVLVACAEGNVASRVVIERAGGEYEDSRGGRRRYWLRIERHV